MNRWYRVMVQGTLLDVTAVVCLWGRRDRPGQRMLVMRMASVAEAEAQVAKIVARKLRRGYRLVSEV